MGFSGSFSEWSLEVSSDLPLAPQPQQTLVYTHRLKALCYILEAPPHISSVAKHAWSSSHFYVHGIHH